jgi:hypothetical protein
MVAAYPIEGCNSRPSYDDLPGLDGERLRLAATGSEIRRDLPSPPKAAQIAGKANARPRPNATSYDRDRDQFASSAQLALIPLEEQDVRLSRITRQAASMIGQRSHNIAGRPHAPPETHRVRSRRRSRKTDAAPCARPAALRGIALDQRWRLATGGSVAARPSLGDDDARPLRVVAGRSAADSVRTPRRPAR